MTFRQRDFWIREDAVNRDRCNINMLSEGTFCDLFLAQEKAQDETTKERFHEYYNYDILMNIKY